MLGGRRAGLARLAATALIRGRDTVLGTHKLDEHEPELPAEGRRSSADCSARTRSLPLRPGCTGRARTGTAAQRLV
jgi:hypothetical protein